jgi:hypothetical protein
MSNREERRRERRQISRIPVAPVWSRADERAAATRRRRVLGGLFTLLFGALFVLGSFTIVPPRVGIDPSPALVARLAERGISVARLDAAALDVLESDQVKTPTELLEAAKGQLGGLTPASTDVVLVTAEDPAPAPGTEPIRFNRALAYAYTFSAADGGYLTFGGTRFRVVVVLVDPYTGGPMIGAGYEPEPAPSPTPSPSPSPSPSP